MLPNHYEKHYILTSFYNKKIQKTFFFWHGFGLGKTERHRESLNKRSDLAKEKKERTPHEHNPLRCPCRFGVQYDVKGLCVCRLQWEIDCDR